MPTFYVMISSKAFYAAVPSTFILVVRVVGRARASSVNLLLQPSPGSSHE
jgi:hypothetical protein